MQPKTQTTEQETPQIPPKPVISAEAAAKTAYADYRDKADKWEDRYGEKHKSGKKAYTDGYRIIKEKAQTGIRGSLQKTWAEGKDILTTDGICREYRASRSREAAYFLMRLCV